MNIGKAILKIKSDAQVTVLGNDIDTCTITWHDGNPTSITKDQIKVLRAEVLKIVGTKLKALDAAVSKNQSISPMIADMKKQLYVKNGPIHNVVYDIMTADMADMISENLLLLLSLTRDTHFWLFHIQKYKLSFQYSCIFQQSNNVYH